MKEEIEISKKILDVWREVPAHFNSHGKRVQSFGIDFPELNVDDEYNMASIAWYKSPDFLHDLKIDQKTMFALIKIGEDIMLLSYILTKRKLDHFIDRYFEQIINKNLDLFNEKNITNIGTLTQHSATRKYFNYCSKEGKRLAMPKILYFEDDEFIAQMHKIKLEGDGFEIKHCTNPTLDPVALTLKEKPDLIFMDIIMPDMDGFTATKLLKANNKTITIPIFVMSNLAQKEDIEKAISLVMVDYWISAKHTPNEVVNKIRTILKMPAIPEKR